MSRLSACPPGGQVLLSSGHLAVRTTNTFAVTDQTFHLVILPCPACCLLQTPDDLEEKSQQSALSSNTQYGCSAAVAHCPLCRAATPPTADAPHPGGHGWGSKGHGSQSPPDLHCRHVPMGTPRLTSLLLRNSSSTD